MAHDQLRVNIFFFLFVCVTPVKSGTGLDSKAGSCKKTLM